MRNQNSHLSNFQLFVLIAASDAPWREDVDSRLEIAVRVPKADFLNDLLVHENSGPNVVFETLDCASRSRLFRSNIWSVPRIQFVSFENMICASNSRLFRSKSWSVRRIQYFFVRKHDLCVGINTFSFEIMICASDSILFRSKIRTGLLGPIIIHPPKGVWRIWATGFILK